MSKSYLRLTIEIQVDISNWDEDLNILELLSNPSNSAEIKDLDVKVAEQADAGAYNVQSWRVSDYPETWHHKTD